MGVSPDKKAVFCQLSIYTKISTPPIVMNEAERREDNGRLEQANPFLVLFHKGSEGFRV